MVPGEAVHATVLYVLIIMDSWHLHFLLCIPTYSFCNVQGSIAVFASHPVILLNTQHCMYAHRNHLYVVCSGVYASCVSKQVIDGVLHMLFLQFVF